MAISGCVRARAVLRSGLSRGCIRGAAMRSSGLSRGCAPVGAARLLFHWKLGNAEDRGNTVRAWCDRGGASCRVSLLLVAGGSSFAGRSAFRGGAGLRGCSRFDPRARWPRARIAFNSTVRRRAASSCDRVPGWPKHRNDGWPHGAREVPAGPQESVRELNAPDEHAGQEDRNPPQSQRPRNSIPTISSIPPISKWTRTQSCRRTRGLRMDGAQRSCAARSGSPRRDGSQTRLPRRETGISAVNGSPTLSPSCTFRPILIPQTSPPTTRYYR